MRKISVAERAVNVAAYRLANQLREFLPDIVRDLQLARAASMPPGRKSHELALQSITAEQLAQMIRSGMPDRPEPRVRRAGEQARQAEPLEDLPAASPTPFAGPATAGNSARLSSAADGGGVGWRLGD